MKRILTFLAFFWLASAAVVGQNASSSGFQFSDDVRPDLAVFPNPAIETISINDDENAVGQILVFSMVGKKVRTFEAAPGERYDVAALPKGMYLVQLLDRDQKIINTQKLHKK